LPLGGFGISRYELDNYLYNEAKILYNCSRHCFGCWILDGKFTVTTNLNTYYASIVLGAFGKDQI
jgi:hypothetical protein